MGAGLASAGASIGGSMKERGDMKKDIAAAESSAKALLNNPNLDESLRATIDSTYQQLQNPDLSLRQQHGIATQANQTLVDALRIGAAGLQREAFDFEKAQTEAAEAKELDTAGAMGDVVRSQLDAYPVGPLEQGDTQRQAAQRAALRLLDQGNIAGAQKVLGMVPGAVTTQELPGGNSALLQGGKVVGQVSGGGEKQSAREIEIQDMMDTLGISRAQAIGLVDNTTRLVTDPVTGNSSIVDMATGQGQLVQLPDTIRQELEREGLQESGADESSINLFDIAASSTGLIPALRANAQRITGQVGFDTAPAELRENLQTFQTAQNEVIRALSINPRFPVAEMERIRKEINIAPGAFKDAATLESQLVSLERSLRQRLKTEQEAAASQNLPITDRQNALSAARDINNFLKILGVPKADEEAPAAGGEESGDDVDALIQKYTQ